MIKGCQREMIVLQTQDSTLFESAYFILRRHKGGEPKGDMLAEANRIIGAGRGYLRESKRRTRKFWLFGAGFLVGIGVSLLAFLILRLCT